MKTKTDRLNESAELTALAISVCEETLHLEQEHLARAAEVVWHLKAELGMNLDHFTDYCEREFGLPAQLVIGILDYHQLALKKSRVVNAQER